MSKERLAIFVGNTGGSTMEFLVERMRSGELGMDPSVVVAPSSTAESLVHVQKLGIPSAFVYHRNFNSAEELGLVINKILKRYNTTAVSLNGSPMIIPESVISEFQGRIFNQHGGPLPETAGLFGRKIAQRVIDLKMRSMPVVIHEVEPEVDKGKIVAVKYVPILEDDTAKVLQARGKPYEHQNQLEHWQRFLAGEVREAKIDYETLASAS